MEGWAEKEPSLKKGLLNNFRFIPLLFINKKNITLRTDLSIPVKRSIP